MIFWYCIAFLQCFILWFLWYRAQKVFYTKEDCDISTLSFGIKSTSSNSVASLPVVGLIIPATGNNPLMRKALHSLLTQDYSHCIPVVVTAHKHDAATELAKELKHQFPHVESIIAGQANLCGQKNHNTLKAIEHLGMRADIYVFCDSTHMAKPNFIRELVAPIVKGKAHFTTGYHQVIPKDEQYITIAYTISVLLMRVLQAVSLFTQPWGGAMGISRHAFEKQGIAKFWRTNVVDDCSLAALLMQRGISVHLCPKALLLTEAKEHTLLVWQTWMQRQVLFLKFCILSQWYLLGIFVLILTLPTIISCAILLLGLFNAPISPMYTFLAIAHHAILLYIMLLWRKNAPCHIRTLPWLGAFNLGIAMFLKVYILTIPAGHIDWHGIRYHVSKCGIVRRMHRL